MEARKSPQQPVFPTCCCAQELLHSHGTITLHLPVAGCEEPQEFKVSPLQATVIMHFEDKGTCVGMNERVEAGEYRW